MSARYRVSLVTLADFTVTVEADSEEDAIGKAHELAPYEVYTTSRYQDPGTVSISEWTTDTFEAQGGSVELVKDGGGDDS